jgi:hypothetical protein
VLRDDLLLRFLGEGQQNLLVDGPATPARREGSTRTAEIAAGD